MHPEDRRNCLLACLMFGGIVGQTNGGNQMTGCYCLHVEGAV